jgi:uncharacterized phage infection (PIP) family protein YhgE
MTSAEITDGFATMAEKLARSDEQLDRIEQILRQVAEERLQFAQEAEERHRQAEERLANLEQIMEKLAEKQFKQDLVNEQFEKKMTRIANLLMQAALNGVEMKNRLDRVETQLENFDRQA